jgi:hypothetical protein
VISRTEIAVEIVYYLDQSGIRSVSYASHAQNACMADPPFGRRASSIAEVNVRKTGLFSFCHPRKYGEVSANVDT